MTWKGTGRSGIGEQTILGDYDDWCGLSMNGRQWKSRLTKETRDLSGADYWHMRKALEPKMPEDIPTFVNGRPNISAFSEPVKPQRPVKKKSVADSIDLAERHFSRMERMSKELDEEYFSGEVDEERYTLLRYKLDERLIRAWQRLEKENSPIWQKEDEKYAESGGFTGKTPLTFSLAEVGLETSHKNQTKSMFQWGKTVDKSLISGNGCVSLALKQCSNNNLFLIGICKVLQMIKKIKGEI